MPDLIPIASIRRDGGTQPRSILNLNWVEEYGQDMIAGAVFPPVVVFYDGSNHWLADGFHRVEAASALDLIEIAADVRQGTQRDAVLYSVGANGNHGQRRTNDDKRRAVQTLLDDPEWSRWSDHEIARRCAVDHKVVSRLRPPPDDTGAKPQSDIRTFTHPKTGKPTMMRTGEINRGREPARPPIQVTSVVERMRPGISDGQMPVPAPEPVAEAEPAPAFDRAAADLHRDLMAAVATFALLPSPREAQDACNKHSGRGVLPSVVTAASVWLAEFAALYEREEPARAKAIQQLFGTAA